MANLDDLPIREGQPGASSALVTKPGDNLWLVKRGQLLQVGLALGDFRGGRCAIGVG